MALLCADSSDMPTVQARVLLAIADIVCAAAKRYGARAHRLDGVRAVTRCIRPAGDTGRPEPRVQDL